MPHFFFNHISQGATCVDDIGLEFSSLEAAYLGTCEAALAIAFEKLSVREDPTTDAIDIIDEQKNLLMEVHFSEVLQPRAVKGAMANRHEVGVAMENCRRQAARCKRLKEDLYAEFSRAMQLFDAIRTNLTD